MSQVSMRRIFSIMYIVRLRIALAIFCWAVANPSFSSDQPIANKCRKDMQENIHVQSAILKPAKSPTELLQTLRQIHVRFSTFVLSV
jgi:hypothetical protein